jgi:hypothetical protein
MPTRCLKNKDNLISSIRDKMPKASTCGDVGGDCRLDITPCLEMVIWLVDKTKGDETHES